MQLEVVSVGDEAGAGAGDELEAEVEVRYPVDVTFSACVAYGFEVRQLRQGGYQQVVCDWFRHGMWTQRVIETRLYGVDSSLLWRVGGALRFSILCARVVPLRPEG